MGPVGRMMSVAIAGVVVLMVALAGAPAVSATPPGAPGLLALACDDGLWTIEPDGSGLTLLSAMPVGTPDWSPGGTRIAFTLADEAGGRNVWTMDADGSGAMRLTKSAIALDPSWSPNGERLSFSSNQPVHGLSGRHIREILAERDANSVSLYGMTGGAGDPAWSPDLEEIAFVALAGSEQGIWLLSSLTFTVERGPVPPPGAIDGAPDWAPSADRYVFTRSIGSVGSIYAVDHDGTDLDRLTGGTIDARSPTYSADGASIAFLARPAAEAGTDGAYDLVVMDSNGDNQAPIATDLDCNHVDWQPIPEFPLVDARFSRFEAAIRWAFGEGISTGCTAERFCHQANLRRGQAASFLARALDLPAATEDHFGDDNGMTHEADINRLAEAGVTTGCAENRFCPTSRITRAELASLLARALKLPAATRDYFSDDDGMTHEANINRLAEAGLTSGCAEDRFCPRRVITRGETVALLYRALN